MSLTVIKLGGSLTHSEALSDWLDEIVQFARQQAVVLVPGGGRFADQVREQQQRLGYTDLTAHRLALLAMCQTAYLLKETCPALEMVRHSGKVSPLAERPAPLLWLPFELLEDSSEVPASWDYTSDSIALWLANRLQAEQLVLVKKRLPEANHSLTNYINNDVLDKGFQSLINRNSSEIYLFSESEFHSLNTPANWTELTF